MKQNWDNRASLTAIDATWVACCIDCEGCIVIHVVPNRKKGCRNVMCYARVNMVNEGMVRKLHDLCGGSIKHKPATSPTRRAQWYWNISANGCRWILPQILPFMIEKRRHAEVMLSVLNGNRRGSPMHPLKLIPLLDEIKRLNVKGFSREPLPYDKLAIRGMKEVLFCRRP